MSNFLRGFSREDEYESQLFGFSCKDLSDHFAEITQNAVKASAKNLKEVLVKIQGSPEEKELVEVAISNLVEKCLELLKKPLQRLTDQLPESFNIPSHILLPSDEVQRNGYSQTDEEDVKAKISELKLRYRRVAFLEMMWNQELALANQLQQHSQLLNEVTDSITSLQHVEGDECKASLQKLHKIVQSMFGLEVREASLKLTDNLSCAESQDTADEAFADEVCGPVIKSCICYR